MALFSQAELNQLISDINDIVVDTSINTTIKYRQFVGGDYYDPEEQMAKEDYIDWSGVSSVRGLVTLDEVNKVGNISIGDTKFVFMQSSVSKSTSGATVSTSDIIVDFGRDPSGVTYEVVKLGYDPLGIVNICYGKVK